MAVSILFENEGKLDCHSCDDKLKAERGHDKDGIIPYYYEGKYIYRCPLMLITPLSYEYLKAFNFYEKNLLPNGNAWIKESHKFTQAMQTLNNEFTKWRNRDKDGG